MEIKKEGEITITIPDEDVKKEETTEKAAEPATNEMVIARIDKLESLVNTLAESFKAMKQPPKKVPPKEEDEDAEKKEKVDEDEKTKETEKAEKEENKDTDIVKLIKEVVDLRVKEKLGEEPIMKRSTAPPEKLEPVATPMDIPPEVMATADVESILRLGGYTMKRD